jgi:RimJ/RimL family protein N-acetyltransferase
MMMDVGPIVLRPMRAEDRDSLMALLTNPDVMHRALEDRAYRLDEAESLLVRTFARSDDTFGMHVVSRDLGSEAIGFSGYRTCALLGTDDVEFGWVIATAHQGSGYATALGQALIRHALTTLQLPRILAACHPENAVSEHILHDKLRMQFEREVKASPSSTRRVYGAYASV